jgi:hypothetical protein
MFGTKVRVEKSLYNKIQKYSDIAGYSSVEEFVHHALEKEIEQFEGADSEEEIREKLKGLGYIS